MTIPNLISLFSLNLNNNDKINKKLSPSVCFNRSLTLLQQNEMENGMPLAKWELSQGK